MYEGNALSYVGVQGLLASWGQQNVHTPGFFLKVFNKELI